MRAPTPNASLSTPRPTTIWPVPQIAPRLLWDRSAPPLPTVPRRPGGPRCRLLQRRPTSPPVGNPANPQPFLPTENAGCSDWKSALDQFGKQTAAWQQLDPNVPAIYWNR